MTGNFGRTLLTGKKSIEQEITEKASDFRDIEIEYQLLAYFLREDPSMLGITRKEWFSDILLQDIYTVLADLRIVISRAMVLNELQDRGMMSKSEKGLFDEALDQLFEVNIVPITPKAVRHMCRQLLRLFESRRVLSTCGKVIGSIRKFDLDASKKSLSDVSKEVQIRDTENAVIYLDHYEYRKKVMREKEELKDSAEDGQAGVRTGIYTFDRLTGGIMPREFGVIAGVTGVGKTAALISFGVEAYEAGHSVMIGSGEMSVDELAFRVDSRLTRIHGMKFRKAELDEEDYKRWDDTIVKYRASKENVLFLSSYGRRFTVEDFENDKRRVEEDTGQRITVAFLDYINITTPIVGGGGGWEDQSGAVWDFKGFCSEHKLAGWTAGQVIDDAYNKELYDAADLKYARAISEAAPIIVGLIQTDKDVIEGRMKFQVIKMRNAEPPKHPIKLTPNLSVMKLHEEIRKSKTLSGLTGSSIEMQRKARKSKPKPRGRKKS